MPGERETTVVTTVSEFLKSRYSEPFGPPICPYSMSMNTKLPGCSSVMPGFSESNRYVPVEPAVTIGQARPDRSSSTLVSIALAIVDAVRADRASNGVV